MRVKVLYFGVLKDMVGVEGETVEVSEGSSVGEALRFLRERASNESAVWTTLAVAVNREYAGNATLLQDGDEIALLPPVSGGCSARVYA